VLTYDRLTIRVEPAREAGRYEVVAQGETSGEAHGTFTVPLEARDVENFSLRMSRGGSTTRRIVTSSDRLQAKDVGGKLFAALFQGDVRDVYRSCLADARHGERGMRVTLALTNAPELMDLPWEFLFDEPDFLSASIWTPVVRYLDVTKPATSLAVPPPLRVLGMVSSPEDVGRLDVAAERRRIETALRPLRRRGRVELHWTQEATLESLLRKLMVGEFHIFHFVGHGAYDEVSGDGVLVLESEQGRSRRVTGEEIGVILNDHRPVRLAVLNACEGARSSDSDPFAGVAASLVRGGLPAVVAMQFEITDAAAVTFAEYFYEALTLGYPVDAATAQARQGIYASGNDVEWGTPVLFMRSPDGRLFDLPPEKARTEGPSLSASLESQPAEAMAGTPITWSLYVENTGRPSLFDVKPRASGSVPACDSTELLSGENTVFTWESVANEESITVTVEAATGEGMQVHTTATGRHHVLGLEPAAVPVPEPEPVAVPEPEPVPKPVAEPEPVAVAEPEPVAVTEREPVAVTEPEPVAVTEPQPMPEPVPEPGPEPEPEPPPPPPPPRPPKLRLAIAVGAVAAVVVALVIIFGGGGGPSDGQLVVGVPGPPNGMTSENDIVWVSTRKGTVGVTDTGEKIELGVDATDYGRTVTGDDASLWVPIPAHKDEARNAVVQKVVQLSSRTGAPQAVGIRPEGQPKAIAVAAGKVYVSQSDDTGTWVQAYNAADGGLAGGRIAVSAGTERIAVRNGTLWVISKEPGVDRLWRYDLANPAEHTFGEVGNGVSAMTFDKKGDVWVALFDAGEVARVNASDLDDVEPHTVRGTPANLRAAGDEIWVTNPDRGTLQRLDRNSGDVEELDVPPHPYSLSLTKQGIWVGDTHENRVTLVEP